MDTTPNRFFKVNWDVAINNKLNQMVFGIIIQDSQGLVNAALSKTKRGIHEPVVGEAMAALQSIEFSRDIGMQ